MEIIVNSVSSTNATELNRSSELKTISEMIMESAQAPKYNSRTVMNPLTEEMLAKTNSLVQPILVSGHPDNKLSCVQRIKKIDARYSWFFTSKKQIKKN